MFISQKREWKVRRARKTPQDDHRCGRLWSNKRSRRRWGRGGVWSTLSKPQIYDVGASDSHTHTHIYTSSTKRKVESQVGRRRRNRVASRPVASRRSFCSPLSIQFDTSRVPSVIHPFLDDWVKRIHVHERAHAQSARAQQRETARPSPSNSPLLRFYSICCTHIYRERVLSRSVRYLLTLIATIPQHYRMGVLDWIYFCALYIHIRHLVLCIAVRCKGLFSLVSIRFLQYGVCLCVRT